MFSESIFKNAPKVFFSCRPCLDTGWIIKTREGDGCLFSFACGCHRGQKLSERVPRWTPNRTIKPQPPIHDVKLAAANDRTFLGDEEAPF